MNQKIRDKLFELADKKYKQFHARLCPGVNNIIGVRVPILRNYAKELLKQYNLARLLEEIEDEYYEEIMLKGILIGLARNEEIDVVLDYTRRFIPKIDNWAICDVFCAGLKITKKYKKEMWKFIQNYLKSDREFEIRFGIVMIINYYIDKEYIKKDLEIFDKIENKDYYVEMAIAWAVSICLINFYDVTIEYLKNCKLDKFTYNKSLQKAIESYRISTKQKEFIRSIKKA